MSGLLPTTDPPATPLTHKRLKPIWVLHGGIAAANLAVMSHLTILTTTDPANHHLITPFFKLCSTFGMAYLLLIAAYVTAPDTNYYWVAVLEEAAVVVGLIMIAFLSSLLHDEPFLGVIIGVTALISVSRICIAGRNIWTYKNPSAQDQAPSLKHKRLKLIWVFHGAIAASNLAIMTHLTILTTTDPTTHHLIKPFFEFSSTFGMAYLLLVAAYVTIPNTRYYSVALLEEAAVIAGMMMILALSTKLHHEPFLGVIIAVTSAISVSRLVIAGKNILSYWNTAPFPPAPIPTPTPTSTSAPPLAPTSTPTHTPTPSPTPSPTPTHSPSALQVIYLPTPTASPTSTHEPYVVTLPLTPTPSPTPTPTPSPTPTPTPSPTSRSALLMITFPTPTASPTSTPEPFVPLTPTPTPTPTSALLMITFPTPTP